MIFMNNPATNLNRKVLVSQWTMHLRLLVLSTALVHYFFFPSAFNVGTSSSSELVGDRILNCIPDEIIKKKKPQMFQLINRLM